MVCDMWCMWVCTWHDVSLTGPPPQVPHNHTSHNLSPIVAQGLHGDKNLSRPVQIWIWLHIMLERDLQWYMLYFFCHLRKFNTPNQFLVLDFELKSEIGISIWYLNVQSMSQSFAPCDLAWLCGVRNWVLSVECFPSRPAPLQILQITDGMCVGRARAPATASQPELGHACRPVIYGLLQ